MKRHPMNVGFDWPSPKGPFRTLSEEVVRQFDEEGFLVLKDQFSSEEIDELRQELDGFDAEAEAALDGGSTFIARAGEIVFAPHLVSRSEIARKFSLHRQIAGIGHDLLGPNVRLYWDQTVYKRPGVEEEFPWHQDNGYNYVEPQAYLTFWVPLLDATEENGCPWVVPGLHKVGTLEHELTDLGYECLRDPEGAVCATAKKGDLIVFSSLTPHKTGANLSDQTRKAYILQYAVDGMTVMGDVEGGFSRGPANDPELQYYVVRDGELLS